MPQRPGLHRPPGYDAERRAHAERDRLRLSLRPSPVERGYDADWSRARTLHLAEHPACCVPGCERSATDVDHELSIRDRPDLRLEPSNFRSFCHQHHAQRTARDQGFARHGDANPMLADKPRGARHPDWLRRSIVPLTVVCGPAASGKSSYVQHRAGPRDLVLDPEVIKADVSKLPLYSAPLVWADVALRWRNSRLALLDHVTSRWPAAWLIVPEPRAHWRQWWVSHLGAARVVVLETPPATCIDRIHADDRRPAVARPSHVDAVVSWWDRYQRRAGDMVIRPEARPFIVTDGAPHARDTRHD